MRLSALIFSVFSIFSLAGCESGSNHPAAGAASNGSVRVSDGWVRVPPTPGMMTAGYFAIHNSGKVPYAITGISSPQFERVEMHETVMSKPANGGMAMMEMNQLTSVTIGAGQALEFKPGGHHLMLFDPLQPISEDQRYEFTLTLQGDGAEQQLTVPFAARGIQ